MPTMEILPELILMNLEKQALNQINVVFFDPFAHKMLLENYDYTIVDGVVNYVVIDDY